MSSSTIGALAAVTVLLLSGPSPSVPDSGAIVSRAGGNAVQLESTLSRQISIANSGETDKAASLAETARFAICRRNLDGSAQLFPCPGDPVTPMQQCVDSGQQTVAPLWQRTRTDAAAAWSDWQLVTPAVCATAPTVAPEMVLAEFRRMTLTPSPLVVQPDRGWVLVNKPTVAYADPAGQTLTTTILGTPVTITAAPVRFTWDFADGAPLTTTSPGHPWPNADVTHTYRRTGTFRITVTTAWGATYTTAGDPTPHDVPGTATTTSTSTPFTANELRSHLVAETCTTDPSAPGC